MYCRSHLCAQVISQAYPWLEKYSVEACQGMLPRSHYASRDLPSQ